MGLVLQCQGRLNEAVVWFTQALERAPEVGAIPHDFALTCLQRGTSRGAGMSMSWRFRCREHPIVAQGIPAWDGSRWTAG